MAQSTLIPPATAAQNTPQPFNSAGSSFVIVGADNLATTETAPLWIQIGSTFKQVTDTAGNIITLTASIPAVQLIGGPVYAATKSATAGACGVYVVGGSSRVLAA